MYYYFTVRLLNINLTILFPVLLNDFIYFVLLYFYSSPVEHKFNYFGSSSLFVLFNIYFILLLQFKFRTLIQKMLLLI